MGLLTFSKSRSNSRFQLFSSSKASCRLLIFSMNFLIAPLLWLGVTRVCCEISYGGKANIIKDTKANLILIGDIFTIHTGHRFARCWGGLNIKKIILSRLPLTSLASTHNCIKKKSILCQCCLLGPPENIRKP